VLVYCKDDTKTVYDQAYGWWCMDCPYERDPEVNPTTKANADRDAKRHTENAAEAPRQERVLTA
jgi:hypothetical protein